MLGKKSVGLKYSHFSALVLLVDDRFSRMKPNPGDSNCCRIHSKSEAEDKPPFGEPRLLHLLTRPSLSLSGSLTHKVYTMCLSSPQLKVWSFHRLKTFLSQDPVSSSTAAPYCIRDRVNSC